MANLFNIDIDEIWYEGNEIELIKLGDYIIYEKESSPLYPLYEKDQFRGNPDITEVYTTVNKTHTDLNLMFNRCSSLVSVNTQDWDVRNVTTMISMFAFCSSLISLDLSDWDVDKVQYMSSMFQDCSNLTSLDLSGWNIDKSVSVTSMFYNCTSLCDLYLNNCNYDTIRNIIKSTYFPTGHIWGKIRTIYCKKSESEDRGLTAPDNWEFSYID